MSCPNFHKVHARNFYVLMPTTMAYDEEKGEEVEVNKEDFDWDMDIDCACERGKEKGFKPVDQHERGNYVRNMDGSPIMEKEAWYAFGGKKGRQPYYFNEFRVETGIFLHSGYYSGANFDWDLHVTTNLGDDFRLSDYDDVDSMVEDIVDAWENSVQYEEVWNMGFITIQKKNVRKFLDKLIGKCSDEADDMCKDVCEEEYYCAGIFSNGEAVYRKVAA